MIARATLSKVNHVNQRFMLVSLTFLLASRDDDARQQDRAPREVQSSSKARNRCLFLDLPLNAVLCRLLQPELQSHKRYLSGDSSVRTFPGNIANRKPA